MLVSGAPYGARPHDAAAAAAAAPHAAHAAAALVVMRCAFSIDEYVMNASVAENHVPNALLRAVERFGTSAAAAANDLDAALALRAAGRLFRALVAHARRSTRTRHGETADAALDAAAALLLKTWSAKEDIIVHWVVRYALLPVAHADAVRRRQPAAVPFCVGRCCAPRRAEQRGFPALLAALGVEGCRALCSAALVMLHRERIIAPAARLVAYVLQGSGGAALGGLSQEMYSALVAARLKHSSGGRRTPLAPVKAAMELVVDSEGVTKHHILAGLPLVPPIADDCDEADLPDAPAHDAAGTSDDDDDNEEEDDEEKSVGRSRLRAMAFRARLIDRAICALTGEDRADGKPGASAAAAAADAAMAELLAEEEAAASSSDKKGKASASAAAGGGTGKNKKKKSNKAPPAAAAASTPHAAGADSAEAEEAAPDAELESAAMARALRPADGGGGAVNMAPIGASVVIAGTVSVAHAALPTPPQARAPVAAPLPPPGRSRQQQGRHAAAATMPPVRAHARAPVAAPPPPPPRDEGCPPTPDSELAALFPWLGLGDVAPAPPPPARAPSPPPAAADEAHEDDHLCVVCLDGPRDASLPGCAGAHADVLCAACAAVLFARQAPCPLCRAPSRA